MSDRERTTLSELDQRCDAGNADACGAAALSYTAVPGAFDLSRSASRMHRACELGNLDMCVRIGVEHGLTQPGSVVDPVALDAFRDACTRGSARACRYAAEDSFALRTNSSKQDAATWANRGCALNDAWACAVALAFDVMLGDKAGGRQAARVVCEHGVRGGCDYLTARNEPVPTPVATPGDATRTIDAGALEGLRLAGSHIIVPDSHDMAEIQRRQLGTLTGAFQLCINELGVVQSVTPRQSTGLFTYDRILERSMFGWRFKRFAVNGQPTPVCTRITFIYNQR